MTYNELCKVESSAWKAFLKVFEEAGISPSKLSDAIDSKDSYNDISDAVMETTRSILTGEE